MADIEQQQTTGVVPPTGGEQYRGILRVVEFVFAIISFACMVDSFNGWDNFSQFKYLVATGVLVFVYTFVLIFVYIFRRTIEQRCLYLPPIELALDGIFCVLLLAAGAAAAQKMNADYIGDQSILDLVSSGQKSNLQASVVFTFFNLLCFIASTFFSYRENAAEERKR